MLALLLGSCGEPAVEARPALWVVRDADTTIWLFGTIHLLPDDVEWQGGAVGAAIAQADTLVTEIAEGDPQAQAAAFLKAGRGSGPVVRAGVPKRYERLKDWAAALAITGDAARDVGASREAGVEAVLARRFDGRARTALESFSGQLAMFDALSAAAQRALLIQAVGEAATARASYARTFEAWRRGDEAGIAATFDGRLGPETRAVLVTARNRRWAAWVRTRLARPGRVLVAVGAGHLVGRDGVPGLLRAGGVKVARLQ